MFFNSNYFRSIAFLVGTIVGVGSFSLPYVINKTGIFWLFFLFVFLGGIQYFLMRFYAEIFFSTLKPHRIPGYAGIYCGRLVKFFSVIVAAIGGYGALLAYIIAGGLFSHALFGTHINAPIFTFGSFLFLAEIIIILFGLRSVAWVESLIVFLSICLVIILFGKSFDFIDVSNYTLISWKNAPLAYGPIFFAIGGLAAVPVICNLLKQEPQKIQSVFLWGLSISIFIMTIFAMVVLGITGHNTTPDALGGVAHVFGGGILKLVLFFGILAIFNASLSCMHALREFYSWDMKFNYHVAWFFAWAPAFLAYVWGAQNLTKVIGITGAVAGGLEGLILLWTWQRMRRVPQTKSPIKSVVPKIFFYFIQVIFIFGAIYGILEILN